MNKKILNHIKKLNFQLKLCKIIILLLLAFLLFPMFEKMEKENIKILESSENLEKDLILEAKKLHDFNKLGLNYVYDFEI